MARGLLQFVARNSAKTKNQHIYLLVVALWLKANHCLN
jgi:hypothetical protein